MIKKIFNKYLLVTQIKTPVKQGSLYVPVRKNTQEAVIVLVSEEMKKKFSPGERILYDYFGGIKVTVDKKKYLFLKEEELLAKIEE